MNELIDLIRTAPIDDMRDVAYLEHRLLPALGFNVDYPLYPTHLHQYDGGLRSWQWPVQFAPYLVWLSGQDVRSYCEIGVHHGGTFIITLEYLARFGGRVESALAVDIAAHPNMVAYCAAEGYELRQLDSHSPEAAALFEGRSFDLAMIDGDHSEPGFAADFNLVRDRSRIIAFHDATNRGYPWIQSFYENWPGKKHGYFEQYGINEEYKPQYGIAVFEMEAG